MSHRDRRDIASAARLLALLCSVWLGAAGCSDGAPAPSADADPAAAEVALAPEVAPPFDLPRLGGGRVDSSELKGRIVIVDFWATWCPPCEFQVPELNAFWEGHRDEPDLALFGVSVDTAGVDEVANWVAEKGVRYPVLLEGEPLARKVGALGFPTLLVIAPDGQIDEQHVGLIERATLEEAIERLRGPARDESAPETPAAGQAPAAG